MYSRSYNKITIDFLFIHVVKLSLTLIELVKVSLLQCDSGVSFVNL